MDFENLRKALIEYGNLKIEYKKISSKIGEISKSEEAKLSNKNDLIQLYRYFYYNTHNPYGEDPVSFEEWVKDEDKIEPNSLILLDLIKQRKALRIKIGYKKASITRYAIKLAEGTQCN